MNISAKFAFKWLCHSIYQTIPMVVAILDFQSTQNHCIWEDHLMIIHVMYYVQFNQVSCFSHDFYTFSHILK